MHYDYKTTGTCSKKISFDMEADGTVRNIVFLGGCPGNLQAIPKILEGWKADDIIDFFSCPQSLPAPKSFPMSQLFAGGGQSTGVSALASFLQKKSQG